MSHEVAWSVCEVRFDRMWCVKADRSVRGVASLNREGRCVGADRARYVSDGSVWIRMTWGDTVRRRGMARFWQGTSDRPVQASRRGMMRLRDGSSLGMARFG